MESSRAKRQRMSSYYVLLPDLPATFESLNDDSKRLILQFVGNKSYVTYAGINKHCKEIYLNTKGMTKQTFLYGYGSLSVIKDRYNNNPGFRVRKALGKGVVCFNRKDLLDWLLQEQKKYVLSGICYVAAGEERIDLLVEVLSNVNDEDDKEYVFRFVDRSAAENGKLNVLKWLKLKRISMSEAMCANIAAQNGHLHIIQWLYEKQGLKLGRHLYYDAIYNGDHLHVMKWLREQGCPWGKFTFSYAVREKGKLNVLQWLHDEGCPWNRSLRLDETQLNPEVVDWLRVNGYSYRTVLRR